MFQFFSCSDSTGAAEDLDSKVDPAKETDDEDDA